LPVVARARGNHALLPFPVSELADEIQTTSNLERPGGIVVLVLDPDPAADPLIEQRVVQQRRRPHVRVNPVFRGEDVLETRRLHACQLSVDRGAGLPYRHELISNRYGEIGPIADQRVDAPGQQPLHVRSIIDRPDLHFECSLMRMANEGG
jgi:hypothetical protein